MFYYKRNINMKTLGEICIFLPKSERLVLYGKSEGKYHFYNGAMNYKSFVDTPDYNEESIIINEYYEPIINYNDKFSASNLCYILQNRNKKLLHLKYVYYYLCNNLDKLNEFYKGNSQIIMKESLLNFKIPIPLLKQQQEIIDYCDAKDDLIKSLEEDIEYTKKEVFSYISNITENNDKNNCEAIMNYEADSEADSEDEIAKAVHRARKGKGKISYMQINI